MLRNFISALILLMCSAGLAAAETPVENPAPVYGVRLAMDVSFPSGASSVYKTGSGFSLGGVAQFPLSNGFYIEPGLLFQYIGMDSKDMVKFNDNYYYEGSAKFYGLRIPVNFGYNFTLSPNLTLGVYTGPELLVALSAKQGVLPNMALPEPMPAQTINLLHNGWKRVSGLWGIGLSLTFAKSYYIGLSAGVNFTPLASFGDKDKKIRIHRSAIAIALGYNF
ncbi:MAG: PorT family protein [Muribaculaceae bacterium]|nr:PorT family protein [Muribaculaceae bacterium]